MKALAEGRPSTSFSYFSFCGACGGKFGRYRQQVPITHAVTPHFSSADLLDNVPSRGPPSALSPMPEPFLYLRVYDSLMAFIAQVTGWRSWVPIPRPTQSLISSLRVRQLQKFKFADLHVDVGSPVEAGPIDDLVSDSVILEESEASPRAAASQGGVSPRLASPPSTRFLSKFGGFQESRAASLRTLVSPPAQASSHLN